MDKQTTNKAFTLIYNERIRQIDEENFSRGHDQNHENGELASAAACYALAHLYTGKSVRHGEGTPMFWPFRLEDWKPTPDNRMKELIKAGALIAAEIERMIISTDNGNK